MDNQEESVLEVVHREHKVVDALHKDRQRLRLLGVPPSHWSKHCFAELHAQFSPAPSRISDIFLGSDFAIKCATKGGVVKPA